ncbi:TPA: fimbrial protein [Stenotrophomonas maltophilia]
MKDSINIQVSTRAAPARLLLAGLACTGFALFSAPAWSQSCNSRDAVLALTALSGEVVVRAEDPVGTVLRTIQGDNSAVGIICTSGSRSQQSHVYAPGNKPKWGGNQHIFTTGIPGIGVRLYVRNSANGKENIPYVYSGSTHNGSSVFYHQSRTWLEVVKIGNAESGTLGVADVPKVNATLYPHNNTSAVFELPPLRASGSLRVYSPNCTIAVGDKTQTINLDRIRADELQGTSGIRKAKEFGISVNNCSDAAQVAFAFSGANSGADFNNLGTATGVRLRVEENSTGSWQAIRADGSSGRGTIVRNVPGGRTGSGPVSLPLRVGYVANGEVRAGTVQSVITVDVSYR